MRAVISLSFIILAAVTGLASQAEAQQRRQIVGQTEPVRVLRVRPRSFLEAGTVVSPGSLDRTTSGFAQTNPTSSRRPMPPNASGLAKASSPIRSQTAHL
jgi:hypothetical protein